MTDTNDFRRTRRVLREQQVLAALRHEGLILSGSRRSWVPRTARALAAGLLLTLSAGGIGYRLGRHHEPVTPSSPAIRLQQSGDAYVRALRDILEQTDSGSANDLAQIREAALAVMLSGAVALSEALPDPAVAQAIHQLRLSRQSPAQAES